ncbi:MAG TPA: TIGR02266 family protein [Polyangiaceae bacterium]|nr:TIGR02266 family protein [Polyangiaceae bacterium]
MGDEKKSGTPADRRQVRYDVDVTVTVDSDSYFIAGFATNLSAGGIFIATPIVHPVGSRFELSIHLDDGDPRPLRALGEVRWHRALEEGSSTPQGIGIQFLRIDSESTERIKRFLEQRKPLMMSDLGGTRGERKE